MAEDDILAFGLGQEPVVAPKGVKVVRPRVVNKEILTVLASETTGDKASTHGLIFTRPGNKGAYGIVDTRKRKL